MANSSHKSRVASWFSTREATHSEFWSVPDDFVVLPNDRRAQEYIDVLESPPDGLGGGKGPRWGRSHWMSRPDVTSPRTPGSREEGSRRDSPCGARRRGGSSGSPVPSLCINLELCPKSIWRTYHDEKNEDHHNRNTRHRGIATDNSDDRAAAAGVGAMKRCCTKSTIPDTAQPMPRTRSWMPSGSQGMDVFRMHEGGLAEYEGRGP